MPYIESADLRTRYELSPGAGPVVLFSNSLGTDLSMWDAQAASLGSDFRILRYDTRGHGQSTATPGEYSMEQLGRDVLSLLDALNIDRVHFCGLSMGGVVGMWLGIHAPGRIHRLVLSNTAARIGSAEMWNARIATVHKDGMKPVAAAVLERWFTPGFRASAPGVVAQTRAMFETTPPAGYAACCAAVRDADLRADVRRIASPTLVIYGAADPVTSAADAQFLAQQIPGASTLALEAAHLSNVEQAATFTGVVRRFLSTGGDQS